MSLFTELKRRNVFRVALFYIVAAWVVIQVAETLLPVFDVPDTAIRIIVLILALGFPLALVFAWAFELTPEGLKLDRDARVDPATKQRTAQKLNWATLIAAVLAIGVVITDRMLPKQAGSEALRTGITSRDSESTDTDAQEKAAQDRSTPASIAVLAFENMSPDPDNAFFAEGISEEILNVLAGVKGLKVASRTSAFSLSGRDTSIPEIAERLGVRHVLEGSVRKAGNRVRITAQLIDAADDIHLWSDSYDRELDDIFAVQEEIARSITAALGSELGLEEILVNPSGTDSVEAYNAFLQGRYFLHKRGRHNVRRAIELLEEAVRLDPGFADAHALLARALSLGWGEDDLPRAVAEAEAALALAPDSAMALIALASALEEFPDRAQEGLAASERALDLRPDMAAAHHLRASYAARYERDLGTCIAHEQRAAELDPTAAIYPIWIGFCDLGLGNAEAGIAAIEAGHALSPTGASLFIVAFTTAVALDGERAIRQLETDPARAEIEPHLHATVRALVDALAGRNETALARMEAIGELDENAIFPSAVAWPYLITGEIETANRLLRKHIDDSFLSTMPFLVRYLPEHADLDASDYREVIAERGLPFYDSVSSERDR